MVANHRYEHSVEDVKFIAHCKGNESAFIECQHDIESTTTRDVFISCNSTGT